MGRSEFGQNRAVTELGSSPRPSDRLYIRLHHVGVKQVFCLLGFNGAKIGGRRKKEEFGEDRKVCKIASFFYPVSFFFCNSPSLRLLPQKSVDGLFEQFDVVN